MNTTNKSEVRAKLRSLMMGNKAFLIVVGLCIILSIASPVFLRTSNLLNIVRQVCVSTLLSVGFTVVLSSGHMDLSVGTLLGLCGMVLAKMIKEAGIPLPIAILLTLMLGTACGALNAATITTFRVVPFVATLATQSIFKGANYLISNLVPVAGLPDELVFIGQGYLLGIPVPIYIMLLVIVLVWIMMNRTKFGRYVLAMGGNAEAARVSGINVDKMRYGVYMVGGFCTGIAAVVMTARTASAQVSAGQNMEMDAIAAVVIGGTAMSGGNANVWGTMFGCLIVGIVNNGLNLLGVDSNWQVIAKGVLILFAVIIDTLSARAQAERLNKQAVQAGAR